MANSSTVAAPVTITVWDETGLNAGPQTITEPPGGHAAIVLPAQLPLTAGKRGQIRLQGAAVSAIALRFTPGGMFISLPPL